MMKKCYMVGSSSGMDEESIRSAFEKAKVEVKKRGMEPISPLDVASLIPQGLSADKKIRNLTLITELSRCDAVYLLENWRQSDRAKCEYYYAKSSGIEVLNPPTSLLAEMLERRYKPHGNTEDMMLKSTAEIAYELEDMCAASTSEIAAWLHEKGFSTRTFNDVNVWIVYECIQPESDSCFS